MLKREQELIQKSLQAQMENNRLDVLLLTSAESVYYATGFASTFLYSSNKVGTALAIVFNSRKTILVCSEFESNGALTQCQDIEIVTYPTWIYIADFEAYPEKAPCPDPLQSIRLAADLIREKFSFGCRVGCEYDTLPYRQMCFLQEQFGNQNLFDCCGVLQKAKSLKTPWEIYVLKQAAVYAERIMYKTAKSTQIGMSEIDLVKIWNRACYEQAEGIHGMFAAHTLADQYSPVMIPRTRPELRAGDIVRLDGGPRISGYASDLARTYAVGGCVKPEREEIFDVLLRAHDRAFEIIGPGVRMCDVFKECMTVVKEKIPSYSRGHVGHSIGVSRFTEEAPFLSAEETSVFQPNMVFCIELPYYSSFNHSYNLEDTFAVTENGIERFTHTNRSLLWP